jgi:hypothetical protein
MTDFDRAAIRAAYPREVIRFSGHQNWYCRSVL